MKPPPFRKAFALQPERNRERGVTMVLVVIAMVAIIAMAALSIDVITLYLAREESQRSADAAALAAARIISISGITGDPQNQSGLWSGICGTSGTGGTGTSGIATQAAQAVATQNAVGAPAPTVTVTYTAGAGAGSKLSSNTDCTTLATNTAFGVNPIVTVKVSQNSLPTFFSRYFSRVWGTSVNSVSATASAEVFNPSNSGNTGNQSTGAIIPVQPRCVKPWVVPNKDPMNPAPVGSAFCDQSGGPGACQPIVNLSTGAINNPGISTGGSGSGIVGENFWLESNCVYNGAHCNPLRATPIQANLPINVGTDNIIYRENPPNLLYFPNQVGTPVSAIPSCSLGDAYEEAIEGCDAPTNYQCGVPTANILDLSVNPDSGPVTNGVSCLIGQTDTNQTNPANGQDYLAPSPSTKIGAPTSYPFLIKAGTSNPMVTSAGLSKDTPISASASIVSLPIYDQSASVTAGATNNKVTFIGFLQVFINAVDPYGNINVTVLNVTGCGNNNTSGTALAGSSPVPIRLITPPISSQ